MTSETKKHIDAARQILVGVVPNPTSQIDQITNALIYKFMDDMDQAAIKQGGDPSFFTGGLKNYSWTKLMDSRIDNQDRMNIYSEALLKFSESKQLPVLFREIFKSAFLSYRSPEVLGLFLKEINYFDYSHPEELGNAYEYLLSVMGSQGDAGQFRTPRHIIDFMVDVVNPTKEDKILDPACGTGGFLVSAYKHILEQHDGKDSKGKKNEEKPLTPDQRRTLMSNFEGYDIDPTMVRIAQVNMYLHQFKGPKIYNYDSLTMEEKWGDHFSVILANPPFMSPKGGVSTHSKFSIQSSRSEVLFVDYIMNHLRPNGRAGIIVPEGIIFQSGTSHKKLRKNLVEDGLNAVISLPSGVFQPYSGVKTSILLFDNELTKQKKEILFIKIDNDGFDLGSNKRPINKNDLPMALEVLNKWKSGKKVKNNNVLYVDRKKIAETGDYNLSGDRYHIATSYTNAKWQMVKLEEVCDLYRGVVYSKESEVQSDGHKILRANNISLDDRLILNDVKLISKDLKLKESQKLKAGDIFICLASGSKDHIGKVAFIKEDIDYYFGGFMGAIRVKNEMINPLYLFHLLKDPKFNNFLGQEISGANINNLNYGILSRYEIPLPPFEIQEQIVSELEGYQSIINGAKEIIKNWKPIIEINPAWEKVKISDVCFVNPKKSELKNTKSNTEVSFVPMSDLNQNMSYFEPKQSKKLSEVVGSYTYFCENDVLLARVTPCFENGKAGIARNLKNKIGFGSSEYIVLRPTKKILPEIIYAYIISGDFKIGGKLKMTGTGGLQRVPISYVEDWVISLPPIETQNKIVERINSESFLIESNKKLIEIYENKIKDILIKLWEE